MESSNEIYIVFHMVVLDLIDYQNFLSVKIGYLEFSTYIVILKLVYSMIAVLLLQ